MTPSLESLDVQTSGGFSRVFNGMFVDALKTKMKTSMLDRLKELRYSAGSLRVDRSSSTNPRVRTDTGAGADGAVNDRAKSVELIAAVGEHLKGLERLDLRRLSYGVNDDVRVEGFEEGINPEVSLFVLTFLALSRGDTHSFPLRVDPRLDCNHASTPPNTSRTPNKRHVETSV